ncbi:hypothetical protein C922_05052 [Plasmodium inui San Antonio 1]|uniref:Uncharacterized protein n=1 Tax=Plasmodium inui San Antonio 1 TaxID=1237626 RepID=W7AH42_9APIC|nr:hypothetical protein C922_05052 [Plasmodium inui San Antonio 1]EUD64581.1 hypothetical protein C922_05052 [Plasmodium inui San Antonio 1]
MRRSEKKEQGTGRWYGPRNKAPEPSRHVRTRERIEIMRDRTEGPTERMPQDQETGRQAQPCKRAIQSGLSLLEAAQRRLNQTREGQVLREEQRNTRKGNTHEGDKIAGKKTAEERSRSSDRAGGGWH